MVDPSFTFYIAGNEFTRRYYASTDGFVHSTYPPTIPTLTALPSLEEPTPVLSVFGTTLFIPTQRLCVRNMGSYPNRSFVIEWPHAQPLVGDVVVPGDYTFELILYEDRSFEFVYGEMRGTRPALVGVEDWYGVGVSGCDGPAPTFSCVPASNTAIRFTPIP